MEVAAIYTTWKYKPINLEGQKMNWLTCLLIYVVASCTIQQRGSWWDREMRAGTHLHLWLLHRENWKIPSSVLFFSLWPNKMWLDTFILQSLYWQDWWMRIALSTIFSFFHLSVTPHISCPSCPNSCWSVCILCCGVLTCWWILLWC